jgi:RNase H-fold protein (predicted Holliday junction resolvase)
LSGINSFERQQLKLLPVRREILWFSSLEPRSFYPMSVLPLHQFCQRYAFAAAKSTSASASLAAPGLGILAVDIGTAKSGFAFATDLHSEAIPMEVARLPSGLPGAGGAGPRIFAAHIKSILAGNQRTQQRSKSTPPMPKFFGVVMGWPVNPHDGSSNNPQCAYVDAVIRALQAERIFAPVVLWDERNSSSEARALVKGDRARTAPEHLWKTDMMAATVILNSFQSVARPLVLALRRNENRDEGLR